MGRTTRRGAWTTALLAILTATTVAQADDVRVAVAANFGHTLQKLAREFEARTGHHVLPSIASTGQLYAQVRAGAPFDVFMSADAERPKQLEKEGLVLSGSRMTYARGQLALWSKRSDLVAKDGKGLAATSTIALADPRTAPYGSAARAYLEGRGLWKPMEKGGHIAVGASVTQAYQFVASGAADFAFIALSQLRNDKPSGHHWVVPTPKGALDQEAVVLKRAANPKAAKAWLDFLAKDAKAQAIIREDGYEVP